MTTGDGTFSFEEFVQVMANMGGISEQSIEDEEEELRQAFRVRNRRFGFHGATLIFFIQILFPL